MHCKCEICCKLCKWYVLIMWRKPSSCFFCQVSCSKQNPFFKKEYCYLSIYLKIIPLHGKRQSSKNPVGWVIKSFEKENDECSFSLLKCWSVFLLCLSMSDLPRVLSLGQSLGCCAASGSSQAVVSLLVVRSVFSSAGNMKVVGDMTWSKKFFLDHVVPTTSQKHTCSETLGRKTLY